MELIPLLATLLILSGVALLLIVARKADLYTKKLEEQKRAELDARDELYLRYDGTRSLD